MGRKVKINDSKTYFANRFRCGALRWKQEEKSIRVAWCVAVDAKCLYANCPKVNNNKK